MITVEFAARCAALRHRGLSVELMHQLQDANDEPLLAEMEGAADEELAAMSRLAQAPCEADWGYDVDFDVTCQRQGKHATHRVEIEGNGGVPAVIEWPAPDVCPVCLEAIDHVEVRALCEFVPTTISCHRCPPPPPQRPAPLPNPVVPSP